MARKVRGNGRRTDSRRNCGDARASITTEELEGRRLFAVNFNITFDPSLTSASAKAAFNYAAADLSSKLPTARNVTINLDVGAASGSSTPGQTSQSLYILPFASLRSALLASNPSLQFASTDPIVISHQWGIDYGEAKMLGIAVSPPTFDATISFGTSVAWNFSTTNRAVSGQYDFVGVAQHEISEAMGRIAGMGVNYAGVHTYLPQDLFRVKNTTSGWVHTYSTSDLAFFSTDNGVHTSQHYFNQNPSGDYGDWDLTIPAVPESCDAFASPGWYLYFSTDDVNEMIGLGYA